MSSYYTVVYDACVLYQAPLRSLLIHLAMTDLYRARWSPQIHEEWMRNLLAQRSDLTREKLERVRDLMDKHTRDAVVTGFESLIEGLALPDANDRHVLACAIHSGAEAIITFNLKDFPDESLTKYDIKAIHPDEFIADMLALSPGHVIQAAQRHRGSLKNPPFDTDEYLGLLFNQRLPETVNALTRFRLLL
ncbi:PIN domain-containing protein [Vreelandella olivaria]|uniref:PIN domain-containing protein n=1 Tax=Vreelandella olivaria TaxID=390919 RepID=A0ABM7GM23_9GAMM|nr:PIN domain-containing protein [Halomonas olivaria]